MYVNCGYYEMKDFSFQNQIDVKPINWFSIFVVIVKAVWLITKQNIHLPISFRQSRLIQQNKYSI